MMIPTPDASPTFASFERVPDWKPVPSRAAAAAHLARVVRYHLGQRDDLRPTWRELVRAPGAAYLEVMTAVVENLEALGMCVCYDHTTGRVGYADVPNRVGYAGAASSPTERKCPVTTTESNPNPAPTPDAVDDPTAEYPRLPARRVGDEDWLRVAYAAPITTGELRSALQPVVFLRLTADHAPGFPAGTVVGAQYWGQGKVVLTRFPDGATVTPVAHEVRADRLNRLPDARLRPADVRSTGA